MNHLNLNLIKKIFQFLLLLASIIFIIAHFEIDSTLSNWAKKYKTECLLIYSVLITASIFSLISNLCGWIISITTEKFQLQRLEKILRNLKPADKLILNNFITNNERQIFLSPSNPSIDWLLSCKILHDTGEIKSDQKRGYRVAIWARDYLSKNPNLLY
ncbi:super-infection exclusion protein B [uncultured Deefgea sp.]|uniref:super-infection exclusion protein B n=1 Tax=uncultured Deefgea sp. TaxID=1304914 RepID=UPI0025943436|nr:super-infection exclusion protein B [uncultured Deefgea sp.]